MSKNEGEFKKRIRENALELSHGDMATGAIGEDYDYIRIGVLKDILEDAKKEFEELIHGTWSVDEEGYHPNVYAKDSWITPNKAIKWFRKWFGE